MYVKKMKRQIAEWVEAGLLTAEQASRLVTDLEKRKSGFGIAQILLMLAAIFLSSAFLLFVSANWEMIPRSVRLGCVIALIWVCHVGGAVLLRSDRAGLGHGALLLGTAVFGGGLSLAGQMYHISGDLTSMLAVWFGFAVLTSVLFRSGAVAIAAGFLALALCWSVADAADGAFSGSGILVPPFLSAGMLLLAWLSGQEKAAHFSFLLMLAWAVWFYSENDALMVAWAFVVLGFALFAGLAYRRSPLSGWGEMLGGAPMIYALVLCCIGLLILHLRLHGAELIFAVVCGLSLSVAALALGGAGHGGVRWMCYAMIGALVFYLWIETVGTILGTSGFFFLAAFAALGLAYAVVKVEKYIASKKEAQS